MELYSPLGNIEFVSNLFIGQIFEQAIQNFLFSAAQTGRTIHFKTTVLSAPENRIDKPGKHCAGDPESAFGHQRKRVRKLIAGFCIAQQSLCTHLEQRIAFGGIEFFGDYNDPGFGVILQDIREQSSGSRPGHMSIHDINAGFRDLQMTKVRPQGRL